VEFVCESIDDQFSQANSSSPSDELLPCRAAGHWSRLTDGWSYQNGDPAAVAALLNHPAGRTIEEIARWAIAEGDLDYSEGADFYDPFLELLGGEEKVCPHQLEEIEELGFAVVEKMEELGWQRSEAAQQELDDFDADL